MKFVKIIVGAFVLLILSGIIAFTLFEKIEPGEIGVRVNRLGDGVVEEDFAAGYHWGVALVHDWVRLDRRTHFLTFSERDTQTGNSRENQNAQEGPPIEFRTRDNDNITVDVTLTYRLLEGEAYKIVAEGQQDAYRSQVAKSVEGTLREELARLGSTEFVNTELRLALAAEVLPILKESLAKYHVVPENLLIRAVRFSAVYENKLQETQLTSQRSQLEEAKTAVEEALEITGKIEKSTEADEKEAIAEWDKQLQDAESTNQILIAGILAEANIYANQVRPGADAQYEILVADGMLAVDKAEALRDELRNAALDSLGGRILQARDAATNLQFESIILNSNDPSIPSVIEIDKLVDLLIGDVD